MFTIIMRTLLKINLKQLFGKIQPTKFATLCQTFSSNKTLAKRWKIVKCLVEDRTI